MEKKQSIVCPANQLFMNLLKEAMTLTPTPASPSGPTVSTSGDSGTSESELQTITAPHPPRHVSEAFRAYVCEQLSRRLATDPDFDAQRHSAAQEAFGKRPRSDNAGK